MQVRSLSYYFKSVNGSLLELGIDLNRLYTCDEILNLLREEP